MTARVARTGTATLLIALLAATFGLGTRASSTTPEQPPDPQTGGCHTFSVAGGEAGAWLARALAAAPRPQLVVLRVVGPRQVEVCLGRSTLSPAPFDPARDCAPRGPVRCGGPSEGVSVESEKERAQATVPH